MIIFNNLKNNKWKNAAAIDSLKSEIIKMNTDGWVIWPNAFGQIETFGTFNTNIDDMIENNGELIPLIEKYYYQSHNYLSDTNPWGRVRTFR